MPVTIRKTASDKYQVRTPGGVKAKGTTKAKSKGQERLLNALEHGWVKPETPMMPKKAMPKRMPPKKMPHKPMMGR